MNHLFLPMSLEEMIALHHISRLIDHVVEQIDDELFVKIIPLKSVFGNLK
ncbi:MAG: hypothetical protein Q4G61_09325 [Tissierellia bacterium]|nr:hypothetical protein [Tissierellia bacterium]